MSKLPAFIDVRLLYSNISGQPELAALGRTIRRALLFQSCRADLAQAETCIAALKQILSSSRKKGTIERAATESALLMQAALLYQRATDGNGRRNERGSVGVKSKLPAEMIQDHELIVNLRNRAIAHVYHDEQIGEQIWSEQAILLIEQEAGFQPCVTTRTSQFNAKIFESLVRLLPNASEIVRLRSVEYLNKLVESLNASGISLEFLMKNQIDPCQFFGTLERAMQVANSASRGEASFVSH
jgi:hypothetical protein